MCFKELNAWINEENFILIAYCRWSVSFSKIEQHVCVTKEESGHRLLGLMLLT